MRNTKKLRRYKPTAFKAKDSHYDRDAADFAVAFIENLCHTKGTWAGKPFLLLDWQEQIIRDLFGILKPNGYRQFNTAYVEIPKKNGKSELAAAIALLLCCGDGEERAEVYGCAADRQQASIVFEVAADMVRMCPVLSKRVKILGNVFAVESSAVAGYQLTEGAVTATKIAPGSVSGSSLRELSVTNGKIAHAAIGTANIQDAAITRAQIADAAVGTAQIGQAAITQALIGAEAVGTTQIADGSITDAKIVELTANKINAGTLSVERLELVGSHNSVVYALNNSGGLVSQNVDSLDGDVLTERSITGDKIVANAITANEIASRTITSNEILAGTITGGEIAADTIEGSNIKAGAITTNHVAPNFGETLDLSSNTGINQRVEQVYSDMDELVGLRIEIVSTSDILSEDIQATTLTARVWHGSENVTDSLPASRFQWKRKSADDTADAIWNNAHKGMKSITLTTRDVLYSATYDCELLKEEES